MTELKLPELGENIETAEVSRLLVSEGDDITADQEVMELDSDKASFPLPCPQGGRVSKILVKEGDTVSVGQTLLQVEEGKTGDKEASPNGKAGKAAAKAEKPKEKEKAPAKPAAGEARKQAKPAEKEEPSEQEPEERAEEEPRREEEPAGEERPPAKKKEQQPTRKKERTEAETAEPEASEETEPTNEPEATEETPEKSAAREKRKTSVRAGPATRRLARELGVNLEDIQADGERITREVVKAFVKQRLTRPTEKVELSALPDFSRWGPVKRQRLSALGRTTAQRLSLAWRLVPHVTQHELADITELDSLRRRFQEKAGESSPKITVTVLALKAAVLALKAFPQFNSSYDPATGELIVKDYYHIGIAVDTEHGLLVPVLRDVDQQSVQALAVRLEELAEKARKRTLSLGDMEGGTFTISNLGGIGGTAFSPIVNYPEVAILGIARARWQPVVEEGQTVNRLLLPLSLSYDHRVINGGDGVRFVGKIAEMLSEPFGLLIEC